MNWIPHILYEDNHYIAISKPSGFPVQPENPDEDSVISDLQDFIGSRDRKPGKAFIGVLHRLDKLVTGVLILAKTSKGQERFNELLKNKQVRKYYLAVTPHKKIPMDGVLTHYFTRKGEDYRMSVSNQRRTPEDQEAVLKYKIISMIDDKQLLAIELITGRRHQIRAQLAYLGCPIIGDQRYGSKHLGDSLALHCSCLKFKHPIKNIPMIILDVPKINNRIWQPFKNKMMEWGQEVRMKNYEV